MAVVVELQIFVTANDAVLGIEIGNGFGGNAHLDGVYVPLAIAFATGAITKQFDVVITIFGIGKRGWFFGGVILFLSFIVEYMPFKICKPYPRLTVVFNLHGGFAIVGDSVVSAEVVVEVFTCVRMFNN